MTDSDKKRPRQRRLHQQKCGNGKDNQGFAPDDYSDVREACDRKLREWERQGVIKPMPSFATNRWLFEK